VGSHRLQTGATRVGRESGNGRFRRRWIAEVCTTINEALMVVAPEMNAEEEKGS